MKITISIPKPCHAEWNDMTPKQQGRHCAQCDHVVVDLTRATDAELVALFTSDVRPKCARFDPVQLDRALSNERAHLRALPLAAFSTLIAVAAGQEALAQNTLPRMVGEVAISRPAPPPAVLKGQAIIRTPAAVVPLDNAITGDTVIAPAPEPPSIRTGKPALLPEAPTVQLSGPIDGLDDGGDIDRPAPVTYAPLREINGRVVDARTGSSVSGALVHLDGTTRCAISNTDGLFSMDRPEGFVGERVRLRAGASGHVEQMILLPQAAPPFSGTIHLVPIAAAAPPTCVEPSVDPPALIERTMVTHTMGAPMVVRRRTPVERVGGLWRSVIGGKTP